MKTDRQTDRQTDIHTYIQTNNAPTYFTFLPYSFSDIMQYHRIGFSSLSVHMAIQHRVEMARKRAVDEDGQSCHSTHDEYDLEGMGVDSEWEGEREGGRKGGRGMEGGRKR